MALQLVRVEDLRRGDLAGRVIPRGETTAKLVAVPSLRHLSLLELLLPSSQVVVLVLRFGILERGEAVRPVVGGVRHGRRLRLDHGASVNGHAPPR